MSTGNTLSDVLSAALDYAASGYRIFPCGQDKRPLVRWTEAATCDVEQIMAWWQRWPQAMIGLPTGSGLSVVDLDVDKATGEAIGERSARERGFAAALRCGLQASTPSGGRHVYFAGDLPTTAGKLGLGIDTRGVGGYVIAPGSANAHGAYLWLGDGLTEASPPPLPEAITTVLNRAVSNAAAPVRSCAPDPGKPLLPSPMPDTAEVREILDWIDPDAGGYQAWCTVLMALHDAFDGSEAGLALADDWSRCGPRYRSGEVERKWATFRAGGGVGIGTLCKMARSAGADLAAIARRYRSPGSRRAIGGSQMTDETAASGVPAHADDALALHFAGQHADTLRHVAPWGRWLRWTGSRWRVDDDLGAFDLVRATCRAAASACEAPGRAAATASAKTVAAVERLARSDRRLAASVEQWDQDLWLLNTPDMVIDLKTGAGRAHSPGDYQTRMAAVSPKGPCPAWLRFLADVTAGDEDLQAFLQRFAGYALTGLTSEHSLAFLHGSGGNGKSVFIGTLAGILGDYHKTAPIETFTASSGSDRHPTELAMLRGARLVTAVETEEGRRWAESRIKSLTGGDRISARFMRQDYFEFEPQFKLLIAGNHKPGLRSVDEAIRRRLHLVPFTVTIPRHCRDPELTTRLKAEWPGILAWAIQGCLAWQEHGLAPPACVLDATADYLDAQDAVSLWLDETCEFDPDEWELKSALYTSWKTWAERNGEFVLPRSRLADALDARGYSPNRRNTGTGYRGLCLKQHDYANAHRNR